MISVVKKVALATGLAGAVAAGALAQAAPAQAGTNCASGYHCVFYIGFTSAKHSYFNSDTDFRNDYFSGTSIAVNDSVFSASNSSNSGYESHYYYNINDGGGLVFCVNPGHSVAYTSLTDDGVDGNGFGQRDEASSLRLRPTTSISCF
jgi:hypothetical protein